MNTTTLATGKLSDRGLWYLQAQVQEMNKKAAKLKLDPMTVTVTTTEKCERRADNGCIRTYEMHTVEVTGVVPVIDGWMVVGKIEFTEAGNFVSSAPGIELDPAYRSCDNGCQHCNTKRQRNDLVVIRHEDGREMKVGRNCLADFIRSGDAESMLAAAGFASCLEPLMSDSDEADEYCRGKRFESRDSLYDVLQYASICVRKLGWVPSSAGEFVQTTKEAVYRLMNPPRRDYQDEHSTWVKKNDLFCTDFDKQEADKALAFLATLDTATNDYLYNLRVLRDLGEVPASKLGLAVSIITASKRYYDEEIKRAERQKTAGPHVGEVGKRSRNVPVSVTSVFSKESDYGVTTIINFRTAEGSRLTWFASGDKTEEYLVGSEMVITFTVKKHDNDPKFGVATVIQRVKAEAPKIEGATI